MDFKTRKWLPLRLWSIKEITFSSPGIEGGTLTLLYICIYVDGEHVRVCIPTLTSEDFEVI